MSRPYARDLIAPVFYPLHKSFQQKEYTHYWLKGGRASGKSSYVSLAILIGLLRDRQANAVCIRQVARTLADSVIAQMLWAMERLHVRQLWRHNKTAREMVHTKTGQRILFLGSDDADKIKGMKLTRGQFTHVWFEELSEFAGMDAVDTILRSLMRGRAHVSVFYTYNPPKSSGNWVNAACLHPQENRLVHSSTYQDLPKEWLGEQFIAEAKQLKECNQKEYDWAYMGDAVGSGGAVFDNIKLEKLPEDILSGRLYDGLDFGYAVDPSAYVVCAYHRGEHRLYIVREYCKVGASYQRLAEEIGRLNDAGRPVVADSAEPRSMDELRARGLRVHGARKGPGSVEHGMKWLQGLHGIVIDPQQTPVAAREFCGYEYPPDASGGFMARFPDADNHTIDAVRYALEDRMRGSGGRFVQVSGGM